MNRIDLLFQKKNQHILSVYFTAGYPKLTDTVNIITELEKAGADMIEIGFPFSDPLADGPVIQQSSEIALKNGMTLKILFEQLRNIRKKVTLPLILMGYLNPVLQFGMENFCKSAFETGIDGMILPDLPVEIYERNYRHLFEKYSLSYIPLITPNTSVERIIKIDETASGFLYLVSSSSTTGTKEFSEEILKNFIEIMNKLNLKNPRLIGFGIKDKTSFLQVCKYSNGGIIGTAFIKTLDKNASMIENIHNFIKNLN